MCVFEYHIGVVMSTNVPNDYTFYRASRSQVEHEDNLINHRISWLLLSHSFLFAAYATVIVWSPEKNWFQTQITRLVEVIPHIGLTSSLLVWIAVLSATVNTHCVRRQYGYERQFPPLLGHTLTHSLGLLAPILLPIILFSAWYQFETVFLICTVWIVAILAAIAAITTFPLWWPFFKKK